MALKVELKPHRRIIVSDCVVTNSDQRTRLLIDGTVPILREKAIMTPDRADTPAKRVYLAVQLMYTSKILACTTRSISPWCATSSRPLPAFGRTSKASIIIS